MKIPIVDLKEQYQGVRTEIIDSVTRVLDSGQFILGEEMRRFEDDVVKYTGALYAIAVANGTDAILLALKAYGIKSNDRVITSALTYYATAGAIARCGAIPVFCDIDPKTYNISPVALDTLLRCTPSAVRSTIKAIIPVHLYGQAADMISIDAIAKKYGLKVIEDAAQAFGAQQNGKKAGALGDAGAFSFYPGKNLGAYGDAGLITTNDATLAELLKVYRDQGNKIKYHHVVIGHNSRMDTVQAAILRVKIKYIDEWNAKRNELAAYYEKSLQGLGLIIPFVFKGNRHIYHLYTLRFKDKAEKTTVEQALNTAGVDARTYYPIPLHMQECFGYLGYKAGDFPEAEKAASEILSIPIYPELTRQKQDHVIGVICKVLAG